MEKEETMKKEISETAEDASCETCCDKVEGTAGSDGDCCRHKHRQDTELKGLLNRLNRIEGQVRGVRTMVEEERYCVDILTQVMAIQAALNSFNKVLLSNHIKTCVVQDIQTGKEESVEELCKTIQKLMK